jgi:3'(2'), 5'-bisphosphate nucleotidase
MQHAIYLVDSIHAALAAGKAVLDVYQSDFEVEVKADQSPLTLADRQSHAIIQSGLGQHGIPVISEEGRDITYQERKQWDTVWVVDPLDGTKEFVKRNGEFTVNIALIKGAHPVLGVVYAPVPDVLYFASWKIGAYKATQASQWVGTILDLQNSPEQRLNTALSRSRKLPDHQLPERPYTIVGSRSHGGEELSAFVEHKRAEKGSLEFIQAGSSLKICLVAEGAADIYPRLAPTMEWDTAAGQAVAECAGAGVYNYESGERLEYNKENLLNPWFVVERA